MDRRSRGFLASFLLIIGLGIAFYSIRWGLLAHDIVVPGRGNGSYTATGDDAVLAGWIYLVIGVIAVVAGVWAWFGGLDDLVS